MILGIHSITTILFSLYVTHTRTRPIIIRLPEMLKRVGSEFTVVLAFEESLALPALSPRRPFSESWGGGRRGGRNEETLDANGERSNVAGKISSGGILAAGCFCIETWPFFFSFYLFLSLPPPSSPFHENSRQNRHWAMWKLARTRKEASVSNRGSPLFPQISTLPSPRSLL